METNVGLSIRFYRSSRQIVDLDNLLKHLCDSGNGILWTDDCLITAFGDVELFVDRTNPRTEFELFHHETNMTRQRLAKAIDAGTAERELRGT